MAAERLGDFIKARLEYVTAGHRAWGAPRHAALDPVADLDRLEAGPVGRDPDRDDLEPALPTAKQAPGFSGRHLGVVAGVAVLVGLVTWALLGLGGQSASPLPLSTPPPSGPARSGDPSAVASPSPSAPHTVLVHVLGAVESPGVVAVAAGSRVADAIAAAGGLRADAAPGELNMAAVAPDGAQILIGVAGEPRGELRVADSSAVGTTGGGADSGDQLIDLNTADQARLETLPGIGPVTAAAIIGWREKNGKFSRVEDLQEVTGIGPKTFEKLAPLVRV